MSSEGVYRGQDNLKTQTLLQKMSEIVIGIYLYRVHFMHLG